MANRKTLAWLFVAAVIIEVFWSWYSYHFMDFNKKDFVSASKLNQSQAKSQKHRTTLLTKTYCGQDYFLLILVSSAPANTVRRRDIRKTWGVDFAIRPRWKTVFLVARTRNQAEIESLLAKEDTYYGDLVRASYYDHYWNQTLKVQMGLEWAARYCKFSFLLKTDDDAFVNTEALLYHLSQQLTPKEKLYMGHQIKSPFVLRQGKWKVSVEEYSGAHYPDFCLGFGYVLSADVVPLLVKLFDVVPAFRLDDVYVGMLADKGGVKIIDNKGFILGPPQVTECILQDYLNTLVWHGIFGDCLRKVFNQTLKEEIFHF